MASVADLTIVDLPSDPWCCGFGGTFSVTFPELSTAMGTRKLGTIVEADVDYLISTDASCMMHLGGLQSRQGTARPKLLHIAEVLAMTSEKDERAAEEAP